MAKAACPWACFATGGGGGALSATHQRESRAKFSCNSRTSAQFSGGPDLGAMCLPKEEQMDLAKEKFSVLANIFAHTGISLFFWQMGVSPC